MGFIVSIIIIFIMGAFLAIVWTGLKFAAKGKAKREAKRILGGKAPADPKEINKWIDVMIKTQGEQNLSEENRDIIQQLRRLKETKASQPPMEDKSFYPSVSPLPLAEKKPIWKKWWFWAIAIFVILIIVSAGGEEKKETPPEAQPQTTEEIKTLSEKQSREATEKAAIQEYIKALFTGLFSFSKASEGGLKFGYQASEKMNEGDYGSALYLYELSGKSFTVAQNALKEISPPTEAQLFHNLANKAVDAFLKSVALSIKVLEGKNLYGEESIEYLKKSMEYLKKGKDYNTQAWDELERIKAKYEL